MHFELISFLNCPYAQRSVITLLHKRVAFDLTYIDMANPPEWFPSVSPLGKSPVLKVDGTTILFESAVINEFIDEVTEPRLIASDPVERAKERGWITHASTLQAGLSDVMFAPTAAALDEAAEALWEQVEPAERLLRPQPLYRGERLSLADAAFAPFFLRMELVHGIRPFVRWGTFERMRAWGKALLALPEVHDSVRPSFRDDLLAMLRKRGSLIVSAS